MCFHMFSIKAWFHGWSCKSIAKSNSIRFKEMLLFVEMRHQNASRMSTLTEKKALFLLQQKTFGVQSAICF